VGVSLSPNGKKAEDAYEELEESNHANQAQNVSDSSHHGTELGAAGFQHCAEEE
jgi:hypothetical protein